MAGTSHRMLACVGLSRPYRFERAIIAFFSVQGARRFADDLAPVVRDACR